MQNLISHPEEETYTERENRPLRIIFGPKSDEISGDSKNYVMMNFYAYSSLNIKVIK
jgi:hypothetical protein